MQNNTLDKIITQIEALNVVGVRAVSIIAGRTMCIGDQPNGRKGDFKLSAPPEFGNVYKSWGNVGLANVDYPKAVKRFLAKIGHRDAENWKSAGNWGKRQGATRSNIGLDGDSYFQILAWYSDGNSFTKYTYGEGGEEVDYSDMKPHLYAKSYSPPSVKTSTGKVEIPFIVRRVKIDRIKTVKGLPEVVEASGELKGVESLSTLLGDLESVSVKS